MFSSKAKGWSQYVSPQFQSPVSSLSNLELKRLSGLSSGLNIPRGHPCVIMRLRFWNKFLSFQTFDPPQLSSNIHSPEHRVIAADVNRCERLKQIPDSFESFSDFQNHLSLLLNSVSSNPNIHYYQGVHQIATFLLIVFPKQSAGQILHALLNNQLADFCTECSSSSYVLQHLNFILLIIKASSPKSYELLTMAGFGPDTPCLFALPWVITWFTYLFSLSDDIPILLSIWDFLLSWGSFSILYLVASHIICTLNSNQNFILNSIQNDSFHNPSLDITVIYSIFSNSQSKQYFTHLTIPFAAYLLSTFSPNHIYSIYNPTKLFLKNSTFSTPFNRNWRHSYILFHLDPLQIHTIEPASRLLAETQSFSKIILYLIFFWALSVILLILMLKYIK